MKTITHLTEDEQRSVLKKQCIFTVFLSLYQLTVFIFPFRRGSGISLILQLLDGRATVEEPLTVIRLCALAAVFLFSGIRIIRLLVTYGKYKSLSSASTVEQYREFSHTFAENSISIFGIVGWIVYISFSDNILPFNINVFLESCTKPPFSGLYVALYLVLGLVRRKTFRPVDKYIDQITKEELKEQIAEFKSDMKESLKQEEEPDIDDEIAQLDVLLQYKALYDSGAITQEDYEKKRAELMKNK